MKKRNYQQYCSLARALDLVGERWTLLIIRDLLGGPRRYKDLQDSLDGIGTNLLANRLKELEANGLVEATQLAPPSSTRAYQLTARGRTLENAVVALAHWGLPLLEAPRHDDHWRPHWNHVALKARFNAIAAQDISETYAFEIGGYPHYVTIKDGRVETREGLPPHADLHLRTDSETFASIVEGQISLKDAMSRGLLQVEGTGETLVRMAKVFTPVV